MPDREKVIREFEHEVKKTHDEEWDFVYLNPNFADKLLAMLKEQEAVEPTLIREGRNKNYNDYVCPRCGYEVVYEQNYCSECGVRFLWEGR